MTAKTKITLQASEERVIRSLPGELSIGDTTLRMWQAEGERRARWTRGTSHGTAEVQVRPRSRSTTEVTVVLHSPKGFLASLGWVLEGSNRLSNRFADALRYEIETRTAEQADAFAVRRTTAARVKKRSA